MGHFIYSFHHQIAFLSRKKKALTTSLNRQVKQGCFTPVRGNQQGICLSSPHTQQNIFLMGSAQTLSRVAVHLSCTVNKQAAHAANTGCRFHLAVRVEPALGIGVLGEVPL